jgi:hypothetical protein
VKELLTAGELGHTVNIGFKGLSTSRLSESNWNKNTLFCTHLFTIRGSLLETRPQPYFGQGTAPRLKDLSRDAPTVYFVFKAADLVIQVSILKLVQIKTKRKKVKWDGNRRWSANLCSFFSRRSWRQIREEDHNTWNITSIRCKTVKKIHEI